jgi:methylmalonyl-CoA carboxyltransferase large subunit
MNEVFAILVLLAILVIGMAVLYVNMKRLVRTEVDEMRTMLYAHIEREKEKLAAIAVDAANAVRAAAVPAPPAASAAQAVKAEAKSAAAPAVKEPKKEDEVPEEVLLVISAVVAAFLGPAVRVRSARLIQAGNSAWAQQGRVFVQASHNLPMAHHAHA